MKKHTGTDRALFAAAVAVLRTGSTELHHVCMVLDLLAEGDVPEAIATLARQLREGYGDAGRVCRREINEALAEFFAAGREVSQ